MSEFDKSDQEKLETRTVESTLHRQVLEDQPALPGKRLAVLAFVKSLKQKGEENPLPREAVEACYVPRILPEYQTQKLAIETEQDAVAPHLIRSQIGHPRERFSFQRRQ